MRGDWTGDPRTARRVCAQSLRNGVARDFGLSASANEFEIAEEFASGYIETLYQPNFEGCLAGLGIE